MADKPPVQVGDVIQYAYLWHQENRRDHSEGRKDRPVAVVLCYQTDDDDAWIVLVCPITHSPQPEGEGIEIPPETRRRLGLDDERCWAVTTEVNRFVWPGPDIRRAPSGDIVYGPLPASLYRSIKHQIMENAQRAKTGQRAEIVDRSE